MNYYKFLEKERPHSFGKSPKAYSLRQARQEKTKYIENVATEKLCKMRLKK